MSQKEEINDPAFIPVSYGDPARFEHIQNASYPFTPTMMAMLSLLEPHLNDNTALAVLGDHVVMRIRKSEPLGADMAAGLISEACAEVVKEETELGLSVIGDAVQIVTVNKRFWYVSRKDKDSFLPFNTSVLLPALQSIREACEAGTVYGYALGTKYLRHQEKKAEAESSTEKSKAKDKHEPNKRKKKKHERR